MNLLTTVSIWLWIGRVLPMTGLFAIGLFLSTDLNSILDYLLYSMTIGFISISFVWWWWVVYAVREIYILINKSNQNFAELVYEIKEARRTLEKKAEELAHDHDYINNRER